jgi:hypothetical protein
VAKKKNKKQRAKTTAVAALPACRLREIPQTPDFEGPSGSTVKLVTAGHVGDVLFIKAEYGGRKLVPDGTAVSEISFELLPDRHTLKLVFVFEAGDPGRGELREDCGNDDSHFLRALRGDEQFQIVRLFGREA